jgi:hypothetical protein
MNFDNYFQLTAINFSRRPYRVYEPVRFGTAMHKG